MVKVPVIFVMGFICKVADYNVVKICELYKTGGSHGSDFEHCNLVGCKTTPLVERYQNFRRTLCLYLLPCKKGSTFLQNTGTKYTALHSRRPFVTW